MRNPHPCYPQSFSSKLQEQAYLPCLNAQCPSPVDYNKGALGVHSPAPLDLEPDPPTLMEASIQQGQTTDKVSASAPKPKPDIEGPQYAQLHHLTTLGKMLLRSPCLDLWFSGTRRRLFMKLWQLGLDMTDMLQSKSQFIPSPP